MRRTTTLRIRTTCVCRIVMSLLLMLLSLAAVPAGAAQDFDFRVPSTTADAAAAAALSDLASRLLPVYQDPDPERYLANLSALQMAVGDYSAADISRQSLRERRRKSDFGHPVSRALVFDIYAHAKALEIENKVTFADAFTNSYRETIRRLDDHDAFAVAQWLDTSPLFYREALQKAFDQVRAKDRLDESEAIELVWKYIAFDAYRSFGSLVVLLNAEDEHRRFITERGIVMQASDGASIAVTVIRPSGLGKPLPALLECTGRDVQNYSKESAAHGYAGVAYTSEKRKSSAGVDPFEFAAADARQVIDWIAKQPWSDGRVGMYGDAYGGYVPWAVAKRLPAALKAIATSASIAPGVSLPMAGNIFHNGAYGWSLQMTDAARAEDPDEADAAPWRAMDEKWYRSGRRYRDLGRVNGKHNPVFIRWLNHPSYDAYWQNFIPYQKQFAQVDIPVLTMTGYYAASEPADLYYFSQHHRFNPHANHTLLIGPYDDAMLRFGASASLHGFQVDPIAALVDFRELRFQWFDHVLKDAATPALLSDRVNYEVMGANEWRHAPSVDAMADGSLRYYLEGAASGASHRLSLRKKTNDAFLEQTVSFTDRRDAAWTPPTDLISRSLAPRHGMIFASDPLTKPGIFNGLFSGRLDFAVNKMDMDLNISVYELLPTGDYIRLFSPTYELRASYAQDRAHRHLLKAGERQKLSFKSERLTSRQLLPGSRIVIVLSVAKRPDRQINYGTGGDVSEESIADGRIPIKIRWYSDSYIDIPVHK